MTTYNTGNPLGSTDPRDLYDNAENLDEAVNSSEDTFQDRLGKSRLTWAGIVKAGSGDPAISVDAAARAEAAASQVQQDADQIAADAAQQAVKDVVDGVDGQVAVAQGAADRAEAASDAAFVNADVYPSVAEGLAATVEGEQFQVLAANGYEYIRYSRTETGSLEVGRFIGPGAPEYGFISATATGGYSPLALDSTSKTITIRGRVTAGTRSFIISEPVTLSYGPVATFIVVSAEVGGTRLVPNSSHAQIGTGDVIVGYLFPSATPVVYGAPHYSVDGLHQGRDTAGIFPTSGVGIQATWPNDHFWTLTGSSQDVLTLWRNDNGTAARIADIGGGGGGHSVSYTLSIDTRTELADFNFAGNVIHHGSMRVVLDGQSRLVPAQDIAIEPPRNPNRTRAVVLNPDTLELSSIEVAVVTPSSGVVLYYYNENKREVHTIYPYRIDGTLVKPEGGESGLATTGTVIFNDAETPQLVIVDDSHTSEDPLPLWGSFSSSSLDSGDVYAWYDQLVTDFPDYVSRELLGMDASGVYPIYGYRFTPSLALASSNEDTPRVFMCAIHSETLNYVYQHVLMREICRSWEDNPRLAALRFGAEFLVMPCANPYGMDQRQRPNYNMVDINRNFPNGWMPSDPDPNYYSGPSPASEIETQLIMGAVSAFKPHVAIDCHAFHGGEDKFVWTPIVDPTYRMATQAACLQVYQKIVKQFPALEGRAFDSFYNPTETSSSSGGLISKFFLASGAIGGTFEVSRNSVGGVHLTNEEIVVGASVLMNTVYEGIKTYKLYGAPRTLPQGVP